VNNTVDQNDPAWKLAEASLATARGDLKALDQAVTTLNATSKDIARAYALCLANTGEAFSQTEATRLILNTRLQVALVEEHVAAQKRMGRTIKWLNWVLVFLTAALVWMGWRTIK
jgi:hypothetical protein